MKTNILKLTWLFLAALLTFTACKDDDDDDPVLVEDGFYVKGPGTALTALDVKGLFKSTRNEVGQVDRPSLMEIYVAVTGGSEGFQIVKVTGGVASNWGPAADFAMVETANLDNDEPKNGLWRGTLEENENMFTVAESGLYHVVFDTEVMVVTIAKADWGIIGGATPGGWGTSTDMPATFDLETMNFEATGVTLMLGDYKFRYSNGWKIIISGDTIKVNTNFGGTLAALVPGGDNINNSVTGIYTVSLTWTLGAAYTATLTKTGEVAAIDYTNTQLGLVGDGLMVGGVQHNWDSTIEVSAPAVNGTDYTWTWNNIEVTTLGSFKIREGQDWNGKILGYPQVTMAGSGASNFGTNGDGNFVPTVDGTYNFTLLIQAATETYTFTVEPVTK